MYNILIGGSAGQGIETMTTILEFILNRSGLYLFTVKDLMSRVRGGHNFSIMSISENQVNSHSYDIDLLVALDEQTYDLHKDKVKSSGVVLADVNHKISDSRLVTIDYNSIISNLSNPKIMNTIAVGAILKIIGESDAGTDSVLTKVFGTKLLDVNIKALAEGYNSVDSKFKPLNKSQNSNIVLNGNMSTALGAIAAGVTFYSAYPMSPSTTIMEYIYKNSNEFNILVEQAEDEIAAINMALGASFTGAKAMTASSGGGFALMVEALGFSGIAEIPLVIAEVQRPGPATGLPTRTEQSDLSFVISASHGEFPRAVISIKNIEDAFYQTKRAFDLAEKYQIPVIILSDQYISDSTTTVPVFDFEKVKPVETDNNTYNNVVDENNIFKRYMYTESGVSKMIYPGESDYLVAADSDEHDEYGKITESAEVRTNMMDKRLNKLALLKDEIQEPDYFGSDNCDILLVAFGSLYGPVKDAISKLNKNNKNVGALVFGDVYPLPTKKLIDLAKKAKKIINVEQNATGQLKDLVQKETLIKIDHSILKYDGRQITADEIVAEFLPLI